MNEKIQDTRKRKKFEELTIADDFMFAKVMLNEELCRRLLEMILSVKIQKITYLQEQKTIDNDYDAKSVRLDVYVDDEKGTVYDIEMQAGRKGNLPKRSRYYQGAVDLELLEKGTDYEGLPESYIIFICTFDLFDAGRHIYTFKNICCEDKDVTLDDGTAKVFVNTKGSARDISPELQDVLDYFNGLPARGGFARELEDEVWRVKQNKEWRREYMTLEMIKKEEFEEGMEIGLQRGLTEGQEKGREEEKRYGIVNSIKLMLSVGLAKEEAFAKVAAQYGMPEDEVRLIWEKAE